MTRSTKREDIIDSIVLYRLELSDQVAAGQMTSLKMEHELYSNDSLIRQLGYTAAQVWDMHIAADDIIKQMNKDLGSL